MSFFLTHLIPTHPSTAGQRRELFRRHRIVIQLISPRKHSEENTRRHSARLYNTACFPLAHSSSVVTAAAVPVAWTSCSFSVDPATLSVPQLSHRIAFLACFPTFASIDSPKIPLDFLDKPDTPNLQARKNNSSNPNTNSKASPKRTTHTNLANMADLQGRKVFKVFNQDFIVDERYTVTKELGQGAYGIVWCVRPLTCSSPHPIGCRSLRCWC